MMLKLRKDFERIREIEKDRNRGGQQGGTNAEIKRLPENQSLRSHPKRTTQTLVEKRTVRGEEVH